MRTTLPKQAIAPLMARQADAVLLLCRVLGVFSEACGHPSFRDPLSQTPNRNSTRCTNNNQTACGAMKQTSCSVGSEYRRATPNARTEARAPFAEIRHLPGSLLTGAHIGFLASGEGRLCVALTQN